MLDLVEAHLAASLKQAKKWFAGATPKTEKEALPLLLEVSRALEKAEAEAAANQAIQGQPPPTPGAVSCQRRQVIRREHPKPPTSARPIVVPRVAVSLQRS